MTDTTSPGNETVSPRFRRMLVSVLSVELLVWLALAWLQSCYN